jgi:RNA polymerase sigma-70 factor (sigma-E family)
VRDDRTEAFERLCRDEYPSVTRTAYLITGDREEAVDIAQEALARAYERWRVVSQLDRPGAWLQRVAGNLAISWRRRQRYVSRGSLEIEDRADRLAPGSDLDLMEALQFLSPAQRAVVVLRYYADQPIDQVAKALDKQPGTVRALASQGLARLRESLREEVDDDARA